MYLSTTGLLIIVRHRYGWCQHYAINGRRVRTRTHACTRTQYVKMLVALVVVVQVTLIIHSTHSILSQSRFEYRLGLKWLRPTAYRKQSTCAVNRTYSSHCVWSLASPTTMCFRSMPEAFMPNDCVSKQFAIHHEVREGRGLVDT